jgi:hypothetical protein
LRKSRALKRVATAQRCIENPPGEDSGLCKYPVGQRRRNNDDDDDYDDVVIVVDNVSVNVNVNDEYYFLASSLLLCFFAFYSFSRPPQANWNQD